jgi:hypothetical protein
MLDALSKNGLLFILAHTPVSVGEAERQGAQNAERANLHFDGQARAIGAATRSGEEQHEKSTESAKH